MRKAKVFPEPVPAIAHMSLPSKASLIVIAWISVGVDIPFSDRRLEMWLATPSDSKVVKIFVFLVLRFFQFGIGDKASPIPIRSGKNEDVQSLT